MAEQDEHPLRKAIQVSKERERQHEDGVIPKPPIIAEFAKSGDDNFMSLMAEAFKNKHPEDFDKALEKSDESEPGQQP